jgi:CubicO group peptidase (beta-lactamase class C family)
MAHERMESPINFDWQPTTLPPSRISLRGLCGYVWFALAFSLLIAPAPGRPSVEHSDKEVSRELDAYMRARTAVANFSGAVLVARGGHVLLSRGYGQANREWSLPNTPHTKFRIGSLGKQFTATLIMQLRERHLIDLQASICVYLTSCPPAWQPVTVHHLLSHTSGIHDFTSDPDFEQSRPLHRSPEQIIAMFRDKPLDFPPGEQWNYSNSGYFLLGAIIEHVTGKSYEDVLHEQILAPLRMADTGYDRAATILVNRAAGYAMKHGSTVNADFIDTNWAYAAGALYSTVLDLYKWDQALYSEVILPRRSLETMWTPVRNHYGYGWGILRPESGLSNRLELTHDGGISGFSSSIKRFPNDRTTVIVLSNLESGSAGTIAEALAAIVFGEHYTMPTKSASIDVRVYDGYVGRYELESNGAVELTRDGNRLLAQFFDIPGSPTFEAVPASQTRFVIEELSAEIEFGRDTEGKTTSFIFRQGNEERRGKRVAVQD